MDRNLANYLFHNETLYAFGEEVVSEEKLEVGSQKSEVGSDEKGERKTEQGSSENSFPSGAEGAIPENDRLDSNVEQIKHSDNHELITNSPISAPPKPPVYPMKTKHLVVVKNLQPVEKELLVKIMTAIKLKMDIVDLVDVATYPNIDFKETIYGNMPKAILFFGPESGEEFLIRLKLEKYNPKVLKGINFLMADNLGTILKDQNNEKRLLWNSLKAVFEV
ncbi:hypothetical protein [Jiulongibacter sediminis]|uniref:Uncharacterized protein n=1 Tax=Jiulongibacter sediminis TaxID=1605367 RepID=A0A0N8H9F3_9BACT|nr:hypothetical protein [Jiulongibacter sediminis]KPM47212.1 hypothetical protein AFM12_15530 [Jiulongibacter sediminis]TBX22770.1 hypothetical protein TK44_15540 [Jiulongibacter sediminis]